MCILLKLDYAKFGVSTCNLLTSKVIDCEEKPLGGLAQPPFFGKGRVKIT